MRPVHERNWKLTNACFKRTVSRLRAGRVHLEVAFRGNEAMKMHNENLWKYVVTVLTEVIDF